MSATDLSSSRNVALLDICSIERLKHVKSAVLMIQIQLHWKFLAKRLLVLHSIHILISSILPNLFVIDPAGLAVA